MSPKLNKPQKPSGTKQKTKSIGLYLSIIIYQQGCSMWIVLTAVICVESHQGEGITWQVFKTPG